MDTERNEYAIFHGNGPGWGPWYAWDFEARPDNRNLDIRLIGLVD